MLAAAELTQQNIFARAEYTGHITLSAVSEAPAMDQRFYPSGVMISALSFGALILCTWLSSLSLPRRDTPKNSGNAHSANSIVTDGSIAMGPEGGKVPSQICMAPVVATFVRGGALPGARGRCAAPSIHVACAALALLWCLPLSMAQEYPLAPSAPPPDVRPVQVWVEPCLADPYLGHSCIIIGKP